MFHQCVGPLHKDVRTATDELTAICLTAGDYDQALPYAVKNLTCSVQIDGLDSYDTLQQHLKLASIHQGLLAQLKQSVLVLANEVAEAKQKKNNDDDDDDDNTSSKKKVIKDKDNSSDTTTTTTSTPDGIDLQYLDRNMLTKLQMTQSAMNDCKRAIVSHLLTSRYLIELIGGTKHPDIASALLKLGGYS